MKTETDWHPYYLCWIVTSRHRFSGMLYPEYIDGHLSMKKKIKHRLRAKDILSRRTIKTFARNKKWR